MSLSKNSSLRFGILGCGGITSYILPQVMRGKGYRVVAVAASNPKRARAFAQRFHLRAETSYASLLQQPDIDAVYIALPESLHAPWAIAAAKAGKHVICEKTLAPSLKDVKAALAAAKRAEVRLLEAFMWRFADHAKNLKRKSLTLGKLQTVQASFGFVLKDKSNYRNFKRFGGGALNDLGGYCLSASRLILGEPVVVQARLVKGPRKDNADLHGSALMEFKSGALATTEFSFTTHPHSHCFVAGTKGVFKIKTPFGPPSKPDSRYRLMFEAFSKEVRRQPKRPGTFEREAWLQAKAMDALRRAAASGNRVVLK